MTDRNKIVYGQWTFTDGQIHEGSVYLAMSLISDSLEANSFEATVECPDKSILDFERNAPLTYFNRGRQIGIFYVQSITRNGPTNYTISATSAIGMLIEGLHYGGIYTGQTVEEVLPSICGTVPYVVKTNLREIALYGWLPVASPRDNLSQVLFAIGAVLKTDLDGVLHIESLWDSVSGTLDRDRMYMGPSVDYDAKVTQVVVTEHQYVEGGESRELFDGSTQDGDIITFSAPVYNLQASGFTILESGANYAKVTSGAGTLTGIEYLHRTRQITRSVSAAREPNVKTVTDATLISVLNSQSVVDRLVNYYKCTETINADAVYQMEAPGDVLTVWNPYDLEAVSACVENLDISLSNTLKAQESLLVGYIPPREEQVVIYDQKEILTGTGSWTPPEGVTEIHAVLIGGGGKGEDGSGGVRGFMANEIRNTDSASLYGTWSVGQTKTENPSSSASYPSYSAGSPGEGGKAGTPGKVLEADLEVTPGTPISFSCGAGGTESSTNGGETTFGELSSASGGVLVSGYTDLTTGIVYAKAGEDGVQGGNGGAVGAQGESVAGVSGGYGASPINSNKQDSSPRTSTYRNSSTGVELEISVTGRASASLGGKGGGGAGGGTEDNPGSPGGSASSGRVSTSTSTASVTANVTAIAPGSGGNGADGLPGATYGSSGGGGHGGGGHGAIGSVSASASASVTIECVSAGRCYETNYTDTLAWISQYWGSGGQGGTGGDGADGCIILYYGVQEVIENGPIMTSGQKFLLDKYGRSMVV